MVKSPIRANALQKGDKIGLVCPASRPGSPAVVARCLKLVEEMGFQPVLGRHVLSIHGAMAGSDDERLEDVLSFFSDESIAGIFCLTGGFGSIHLLPNLNYNELADRPKVIVGCDDNTHLLLSIHALSGLVTFHGPNLDQINDKYSFDRLKAAVSSPAGLEPVGVGDAHNSGVIPPVVYSPVPGRETGRLLGGNLTALTSLMGTPFEPDCQGSLLFLEDVNERWDVIDRWFTTLWLAGKLEAASAVAFGYFEGCGAKGVYNVLSLEDMLGERLQLLGKPSCFGLPFGQGKQAATIPIGLAAALDAISGRIEFLEAAVL